MTNLIALSGYAQSGKDTFGSVLSVEHGFYRVAFADAIKRMALNLDPILEVDQDVIETEEDEPYKVRLSDIVKTLGSLDKAKELPAVRAYLQRLGVECRDMFGKDAWTTAARLSEALAEHGYVVVTDCRFKSEAQAVKDLGGIVVRVKRSGVGPANSHISEHDLDDWPFDAVVNNDGSVVELYAQAGALSRGDWPGSKGQG